MARVSPVSFPMNGGDGQYSYTHNSSLQRAGVESAKALINEAIVEKLDVKQLISSSSSSSSSSSLNSFKIADLGCSVGPNTFIAVENIIESVKLKYQFYGPNSQVIEFQVFFVDHTSNDFNMLFKSLPSERQYFAAGVPGSFHGRLFPKASLHFVYSSYALHWLSKVPNEMAWNKGRIYYTNARSEVFEAYSAQFAEDMEFFLKARAQELVFGGLMALVVPCLQDDTPPLQCSLFAVIDFLGASLMDMANEGLISEDKVDSFNFPNYFPTIQELKELIERDECFSIERIEPLVRAGTKVPVIDIPTLMLHYRAGWEGVFKVHFGSEVIDELFDRLKKKIVESSIFSSSSYRHPVSLFVVLKRRVT